MGKRLLSLSDKKEETIFVYHIEKESLLPHEAIDCIKGQSSAIKETHLAMFPGQNPIEVRIKPIEKGSSQFLFDILNFASEHKEMIGAIGTLATSQNMEDILKFLGLIKSNVISLKEILENGFTVKKDKEGKAISIVVSNINITITSPEVLCLFNFGTINITKKLNTGLIIDSENSSSGYIYNKKRETGKTIATDYKKILSSNVGILKDAFEEDSLESESVKWLTPVKGSYGGEDYIYQFAISGTEGARINAKILDENFLADIESAEIRLHSSDKVKVKLKEYQKKKGREVKVKYEILEVLEYEVGSFVQNTKFLF